MTDLYQDAYEDFLWTDGFAGVYNRILNRDKKPLFPSLAEINGWDE